VNLATDVPIDGSIEIKLPSGYPTAANYIYLDLNKGSGNLTIKNCISDNGHNITILCSAIGSGISSSSPIFYIYLFKITNPSTVRSISGLEVATKLNNGLRVNINSPSASIAATIPSTITFLSTPLTQTNNEINSNFGITLFMVLPRRYESGGSISIYLPRAVTVSSSMDCKFTQGWASFSSGRCITEYGNNAHYISGIIAYPSGNSIELIISNLVMPPEVRELEPIYIITRDANTHVISQSDKTDSRMILSLQPRPITHFTLIRDSSNLINEHTTITAKLTIPGTFMRMSRIHLTLPREQILSTDFIAGTMYTCDLYPKDEEYITVACHSNAWCSLAPCSANTPITLTIDGFVNPPISYPYKLPAKASVYHFDPPYNSILYLAYETINQFYFPPLLPKPIDFSLTIIGSKLAGALSTYELSFTTHNELPIGCLISLSFPDDFAYSSGSDPIIEGLELTTTYYTSGAIKHIYVTNACPTKASSKTLFTWKINNILNAPHTLPADYQAITITTETNDNGMLDKGSNVNQITLESNTLLNPLINMATPVLAGSLQTVSIEFTLKNRMPKANGYIKVILPPETCIEDLKPVNCQVQFNSMTSTCKATDKNTIIIEPSGIPLDYLASGTKVIVSFNSLRVPRLVKKSSHVIIKSYLVFEDREYEIDRCDDCGTIIPTQPNSLLNVTIVRNETLINMPVQFDIKFVTSNPIAITGILLLHIPIQGAIIGDEGIANVKVKMGAEDVKTEVKINEEQIEIIISEFCSECEENKELKLKVTGLKNTPNAILGNFYFSIHTKDKQDILYDIDTSGNILATPQISAGQLSRVSITRGVSNILASPISYTIEFTLTDAIENDKGQISIYPYIETMMTESDSIKCSMWSNDVFVEIPCVPSLNCIRYW